MGADPQRFPAVTAALTAIAKFPAFLLVAAMISLVFSVFSLLFLIGLSEEGGGDGLAVPSPWSRRPGQFRQRRQKVRKVAQVIGNHARLDPTGPTGEKGDP